MPDHESPRGSPGGADAVVIELPGPLRDLNGGRATIEIDTGDGAGTPRTVGGALARLREELPTVYDRLITERGEVRTHVNLFVDGGEIRHARGLDTPVEPGTRILVVPAVSGG